MSIRSVAETSSSSVGAEEPPHPANTKTATVRPTRIEQRGAPPSGSLSARLGLGLGKPTFGVAAVGLFEQFGELVVDANELAKKW